MKYSYYEKANVTQHRLQLRIVLLLLIVLNNAKYPSKSKWTDKSISI